MPVKVVKEKRGKKLAAAGRFAVERHRWVGNPHSWLISLTMLWKVSSQSAPEPIGTMNSTTVRNPRRRINMATIRAGCLGAAVLMATSSMAADSLADRLRQHLSGAGNSFGGSNGFSVGTNPAPSIPGLDAAVAGFLEQLRPLDITNPSANSPVQPNSLLSGPTPATASEWIVTQAPNGTARQLRRVSNRPQGSNGRIAPASVLDPERNVRSFLAEQGGAVGLVEPNAELDLVAMETDELGYQHFRFRQQYAGLPVWPTGLTVHLDPTGDFHLLDAAIVRTPTAVEVNPAIQAETAVERTKARIPGGFGGTNTPPELIVYAPLQQAPALAWKFNVRLGWFQSWTAVVDAQTAAVLRLQSDAREAQAQGSGLDMFGQLRRFPLWSASGGYYLMDTTKPSFRPEFDPATNPQGVIAIVDLLNREFGAAPPEPVFSTNPDAWSSRDAVSALVNLGVTYDYFLNELQRNGLSGSGGNLFAVVRVGNLDNAQYNDEAKVMIFGDVRPFVASLDVVAHELGHGVTASSANLEYLNQSGALNEAFSDIFGELVENYAQGSHDWRVGSALSEQLRDFKNPGSIGTGYGPNPSKVSEYKRLSKEQDGGGVHVNSSIINHAFYQLAEGLPNHLSLRDAAAIFYRCLTVHLQPQSQFIDCRLGCIAAAEALFPDDPAKVVAVADAFDAVEILDLPPTPSPGQLPAVDAPDSALAVYHNSARTRYSLARRESAKGDDPVEGSMMLQGLRKTRISVAGDGSAFAYVDESSDLCASTTATPSQDLRCFGLAGLINSVAISANASRFAAVLLDPVTGLPRDRLFVSDGKTYHEYPLRSPAIDGVAVDTILRADQLSFSPDGRFLLYDALSEVRFGNGPKVQRWSIYLLDLEAELVYVVVPPFEDYNIGNPVFGHTSDRFIAFEGQHVSTHASAVLTYDRFSGKVGEIGVVNNGYGFPEFTGDDRAIVFANGDTSAALTGFSLYRQGLAEDRVTLAGKSDLWLHDAVLGVVYRRGSYRSSNQAPTVSLAAQPNANSVRAGTSLTLNAVASDGDGSIARVEFWSGGTKLGEDTAAPFSLNIPQVGVGAFNFVARAVDNLGASTDSTTFRIVAALSPKKLMLSFSAAGGLRLVVDAVPGVYAVEFSSDLQTWFPLQDLTVGASGHENFTYTPSAGSPKGYLRLR